MQRLVSGSSGVVLLRGVPSLMTPSGQRMLCTSLSLNNNTWRLNYRENGQYKHVLLSPTNVSRTSTSLQKRDVKRGHHYTGFAHGPRPITGRDKRLMWALCATVVVIIMGAYLEQM